MSRRVRHFAGVSLFPFLAVLICIMGALVVLLVLMVARVGTEAVEIAETPLPADNPEVQKLREQIEDAQWRRELLEQQRAEKTQELAEQREELEHLEDHIRRLKEQAQQLLARAQQIDKGARLKDPDLAAAEAEIWQLKQEIFRKQAELDAKRQEHAKAQQSYALIPYDGPQGTRRRPIYIECTERGIVLQPEGIVFKADDFNGPMGPGNPLDAALRTIREYLATAEQGKAGDPYPLLVVRPGGVLSYGAARAALKSWDDEFGYELIAEDKKLVFGEPNVALAALLEKSVAAARLRQAALVAAMPRRFQGDEPLVSFDPASIHGGTGGGGLAPSGVGMPGRSGGMGTGGAGVGFSPVWANGGSAATTPSSDASGPSVTGQPGASDNATQSTPSVAGPYGGSPPRQSVDQTAATNEPKKQHSGDPRQVGAPGGVSGAMSGKVRPLGGKVVSGKGRGANWGLPGASGRVTAITRPINVAVLADRVILVPERGETRPAQQLLISPELTQPEADAFVEGVQREMRGWGLAVEGGYWKPVLEVEVAPDAEHHFRDLQTALQGSGFEVQRKLR